METSVSNEFLTTLPIPYGYPKRNHGRAYQYKIGMVVIISAHRQFYSALITSELLERLGGSASYALRARLPPKQLLIGKVPGITDN